MILFFSQWWSKKIDSEKQFDQYNDQGYPDDDYYWYSEAIDLSM